MREIKFRAWIPEGEWEEDGESRKMVMCYDLAFEDFEPLNDQLAGVKHLMQFTGLHDRNGKEIYEGDIVKYWNNPWNCGGLGGKYKIIAVIYDLFRGRIDRVQMVIERLRFFEPPEGYYLAYSGGKDSDTILALAKMAGVKFDAHYHLTTVDPPELVYHVRRHPEVIIDRPVMTMWQLIRKKRMPPTRMKRYCCEYFKEHGGVRPHRGDGSKGR